MTPEFCGKCVKAKQPCASGLADAKGKRCPQVAHACRTAEGEAVWRAVSRSGGWTGGGMVPRRLDRAAIRARLPEIENWILEELMDAFEPAALAASAKVEEAERATRKQAGKGPK